MEVGRPANFASFLVGAHRWRVRAVNVTLDVFSALVDSRTGACAIFDRIAAREHWPLGGEALYAAWDREHKRLQLECRRWQPFAVLGRQALEDVLEKHHLVGDVSLAMTELWASLGDWPLWPDVERGVHALVREHRVGVLSNVDDELLARTRVAGLPLTAELVITSERLRLYKPDPALYHAARTIAGPSFLHVAASARDVRGALEARIPCVRLVRPGHELDRAGPRPTREIRGIDDLAAQLRPTRISATAVSNPDDRARRRH